MNAQPIQQHNAGTGTSGYKRALQIERFGLSVVLPYFRARSEKVVWLNGNEAQKNGDFAVMRDGEPTYFEAKCEERNPWGNFFCETWSNREWANPGWMHPDKCWADFVAYYFIESDELYLLSLDKLRQFVDANVGQFPEKAQSKNPQPNGSFGRLVPIRRAMPAAGTHRLALQPGKWRDARNAEFLTHQTAQEWAWEYEGLPAGS